MLLETTRLQNQWAQGVTVGRSKPFRHTEHSSTGAIKLSPGAASVPCGASAGTPALAARLSAAPGRTSGTTSSWKQQHKNAYKNEDRPL